MSSKTKNIVNASAIALAAGLAVVVVALASRAWAQPQGIVETAPVEKSSKMIETTAQVYFISPGMEKAITYCLTGLGVLFLSYGGYWAQRAWKLRNLPTAQRKDDPRVLQLESDYKKLREDLRHLEVAVTKDGAKTTKLEESMHARLDTQDAQVEELKDYVHKFSHKLRDEMGAMQGNLLNQMDELGEKVSGLGEKVGTMSGVLGEVGKNVERALKLWSESLSGRRH